MGGMLHIAMASRWEQLLVVMKEDMMAVQIGGESGKTKA